MLNQPITSNSHWRIPQPQSAAQEAQPLARGWALLAAAARFGEWARTPALAIAHAVVAGVLVGGVLVAPVLATLALVGLIAPQLALPHRAAPALIVISLLWLALAIFGAHSHAARSTTADADGE